MASLDEMSNEELEELQAMNSREVRLRGIGYFHKSLPAIDKRYKVFRYEGAEANWVPINDIRHYPWIAINSYWALEDGVPMETITPECFQGVNTQGVSLIALDVSKAVEDGQTIHLKPSIQCKYEGRRHFIYRLENYLPYIGIATPASLIAFSPSVANLETALDGRYLHDEPILNPCADVVQAEFSGRYDFSFADFRNAHMSPEEMSAKRIEGKRRQAEAGPRSGVIRKRKTTEKIVAAILKLKAAALPLDQGAVAKEAGRGRRTVIRHWNEPEVKKARGA